MYKIRLKSKRKYQSQQISRVEVIEIEQEN
jgi:hypothetical protein